VKLAPEMGATDEYTESVLGFRGQLAGDVALGPGRVMFAVAFGRAALSDGSVVGQIDGLAITAGYEWWFGARSK
jgi:hypothetical protein